MCIYKRKNKKGDTRYTVVPDQTGPDGKRLRKGCRTFANEKEAKAYERKYLSDVYSGAAAIPSAMDFEQMSEIWLKAIKGDVAPSTYDGYRRIVKKHLAPVFGNMKVQDIKRPYLRKYITTMAQQGSARRTIEQHRSVLLGIFSEAIDYGFIYINPAVGLKIPKTAKRAKSIMLYGREMLMEFLQLIKGKSIALMVLLCLYHGLRRGEACGLKWIDVNWVTGVIEIQRQRIAINGSVEDRPLKTDNAYRKLQLTPETMDALSAEYRKQQKNKEVLGADYHDAGYVLVHNNGQPYHPTSRSNQMTKLWKNLGFPPFVLHNLRHTFARVNYDEGMCEYELMKAMGHGQISTTYDYIEKLKEVDRVTPSRVGDWLSN